MRFTFKSKFLFILVILTSIVLSAEGKIGKPKTLCHATFNNWYLDEVKKVIFIDNKIITSSPGMAKLWDRNGNLLQTLQHISITYYPGGIGYGNIPVHVSFSHDGNIIATTSGHTAILRNWYGEQLATLKHESIVNYVVFNRNSTMVATVSDDGTVKVWTPNGTLRSTLQDKKVYHATFSHDGTMIATISKNSGCYGEEVDQVVKVWASDGKLLHAYPATSTRYNNFLTFSHDDSMIGSSDSRIWSQNGKLLFSLPKGSFNDCSRSHSKDSVIFSQDDTMITTISSPYSIDLWSLDGNLIRTLKHDHNNFFQHFRFDFCRKKIGGLNELSRNYDVAFNHDNTMIATTITLPADGTARIWDKNGNLLHTLRHGSRIKGSFVHSVFFSDDNRLATASNDGIVKIWDLKKK